MKKNNLKKILLLSLLTFTLSKKDVNAKDLDDYLVDQIKYYIENPDMINRDIDKEIVLFKGGYGYNLNLNYSISHLENRIGDFVYVYGKGNTSSDGSGNEVEITNYESDYIKNGYTPRVIVGVKTHSEYPYAIAEYDEETHSTTGIIGWFKDKNVTTRIINNYNVYDAPVVSKIVNVVDADETYKRLTKNTAIKVEYSKRNLPNGYFLKKGYYVDEKSKYTKRQQLNKEQIKTLSKYNIKNN